MGGKRVKIDTNFQLKKCAKKSFVGKDDRISQLPDEILIDILSLLSINEAARTSVLSSRWINLWKHTNSLNFDALSALREKLKQSSSWRKFLKSESSKYVKWVNSVIQSHKSPTLKEFKIRFDLNRSCEKSINRWLDYAFARRVERLELYLDDYSNFHFSGEFLFYRSSAGAPRKVIEFKSLKALTLKNVDLTGEEIEYALRNCPSLEQLSIHNADRMSNLKVCGSSLVLKHLVIVNCYDFKSLKVSAPMLTKLEVKMFEELFLENVPMLAEVSLRCDDSSISVRRLFSQISCCVSQLEILCLELLCGLDREQEPIELCQFPEMPKLKKLVIKCFANGDESLVRLTALMRAFPYLEEFVLKYNWFELPRKERQVKDAIIRSPHHHLKVFQLCGYYGRTCDAELIEYILENCVALEKIIVDHSGAIPFETDEFNVEQTAWNNAKQQVEPIVPRHVQLFIQ